MRFRIDGVLHEVDKVPTGVQAALISRLKIMSSVDISERRVPQSGRITVRLNNRDVDLRVATLPTVWGEGMVLRVLDIGGIDLDLAKLGFTPANYARYSTSFTKPHGLVLVTGPTGSGKSTTLYATLTGISKPEVNIITVEDPVEYRLDGVNQIQVNHKAGLTFAAVLPAILRSDPDIMLIGEIRDGATAQLASRRRSPATSCSPRCTPTTRRARSRGSIEMGIEPFLVGSSLDCVLAQRLARRLCDWCKQAYTPDAAELAQPGWPRRRRAPRTTSARDRLPFVRQHRLPRPAGPHRGHAGVRSDREPGGRSNLGERNPARRPGRGHGAVAHRWPPQGRRRAHLPGRGIPCHRLIVSIDKMLGLAVELGASDLHVTAGVAPSVRLHGSLRPLPGFAGLTPDDTVALARSVVSDEQWKRFEYENELDTAYACPASAGSG